MLTPKQNLLETLKKDGKPERWVNQYEPFRVIKNDPVFRYVRSASQPGKTLVDVWGTTMTWPEGDPGAVPYITPGNKALPDITRWRETVRVPDLIAHCSDGWEDAKASFAEIDRDSYLTTCYMGTGIFEQSHFLMGFEDTLTNLLIEPDCMHELLEAIYDYRMIYAKLLIDNLRPDTILFHDDWGSKTSLFMRPDTWREFFKPLYKKLYGYVKSEGVMVLHHSDSYCEDIAEDMADIGIDIWQGVLPQNNIPKILRELGGRMTLMGGVDASIVDTAESTEPIIRQEIRRVCTEYGPYRHFMPSLTYGGPSSGIFPNVDNIISDEIEECNRELFARLYDTGK